MKYNRAARLILDLSLSDEDLRKQLIDLFSGYFFTDKQCQTIFLLLQEFRSLLAKTLLGDLRAVRLRNLKKNLLAALEERRFKDNSAQITPVVVEAISNGLSRDDFNELMDAAKKSNAGLYDMLTSMANKLNSI